MSVAFYSLRYQSAPEELSWNACPLNVLQWQPVNDQCLLWALQLLWLLFLLFWEFIYFLSVCSNGGLLVVCLILAVVTYVLFMPSLRGISGRLRRLCTLQWMFMRYEKSWQSWCLNAFKFTITFAASFTRLTLWLAANLVHFYLCCVAFCSKGGYFIVHLSFCLLLSQHIILQCPLISSHIGHEAGCMLERSPVYQRAAIYCRNKQTKIN